jgi:hypothetical protein
MNRSFTSNSTGLSGGDNPLIRHRHKVDPYVSPFILNAKKKAEERAKLARMKMRKNHSPSRNEWDITPVNSGLFDPTIRKQEIFRLGPRSQKNEEEEKPEHRNNNENNPQRMGTASDQKQKVSHPSSAQQIPPKLSKGVTFAKSKPVGQTRSNHFMAPKAEIKPVHEASYNHNCPLKFSNSSGGKITMKTIASVPKRTPLSTNVQKEKESGKEAQQVIEPNQEHILQQHSNSHDIISDPEHERDLLYPHSPSLQVQDHPSVVAHTFNTMIQPTSDSVAKLTLTSEPQLTALDPLHIIRPTSTAMLPQDTGLPLMIQPRNTLPISQPSFPNTTHVPPSHDPQHIETTEPLDRAQDMNGYYKQMIRDRLRALWQKHRGESASDEGEQRKIVRTKGRNKGVPFHAAPHGHDSQIYMRDMMASMAQIMTAVGEIVTSNTNSRNGKNRRRRSRSVRDLNQDAIPIVNENGQYVPSTETDNFMLEMAQAMNPHAKSNFPKRKSEVLDLVMQKLQVSNCSLLFASFVKHLFTYFYRFSLLKDVKVIFGIFYPNL